MTDADIVALCRRSSSAWVLLQGRSRRLQQPETAQLVEEVVRALDRLHTNLVDAPGLHSNMHDLMASDDTLHFVTLAASRDAIDYFELVRRHVSGVCERRVSLTKALIRVCDEFLATSARDWR